MSVGYNKRNTTIEQHSNFSNGNTLYVGGSGPNNYTKIQDAIDNASDSDTVFVYEDSSPYYENVWINNTINLIGENRNSTVIDGNYSGNVINISADWVSINGFTIQNSGEEFFDSGIVLRANYITLRRNNILNNSLGISQDYSNKYAHINISENIFRNNYYGLGAFWLDSTISHNKFISNNNSIYLAECSNNTCIGNNFSYNYDSIQLSYSFNNRIIDNKFLNNNRSIELHEAEHNTILNNIVSNNYGGIKLLGSLNNIIINNNISKSRLGIFLLSSNNNTIIDNDVTKNEDGIYFFNSVLNNLKSNSIKDSTNDGLDFVYSNNNSVIENYIENNNIGIHLYVHSNDNLITGNNIIYNFDGIIVSGSNRNNSIYHNNLINEDNNARDSGNNIWDDGNYGNYWGDYKEKYPFARKIWSKGIWNTPYEIPYANNTDRFPLVNQWPDPRFRAITRDTAPSNPCWLRFIDIFPILQRILDLLK